jgi:hypothetical protein
MPDKTISGPFVQVAAICATPLVEQQGFLSVIRIQDRLPLAGPTDQMRPQPLTALWMVISLKSGEMRGKYTLQIVAVTPSGKRQNAASAPALFEGEERGVVIATPIGLVAEEEGLYWFEVTLEGAVLTQIPLRVMYQKMQLPPGMAFPPSIG